ncbi:MAG: hypothetical protein KBD53_05825 [Candidatus Omnitrophica bacterium]|nr:hypothetical protein [Candidatus Omnitrophota bacterium]
MEEKNYMNEQSERFPNQTRNVQESIAVYTVLTILIKMREQLGLEAMLEYLQEYANVIERNNPKLKDAVLRALKIINVKKMYGDALRQ